MRCFYFSLMLLSFVVGLILPPLAMQYAASVEAAAMEELPPCHQQAAKQENSKGHCGQDFARCKCCVVQVMLPPSHDFKLKPAAIVNPVIVLNFIRHFEPELLVPPPRHLKSA